MNIYQNKIFSIIGVFILLISMIPVIHIAPADGDGILNTSFTWEGNGGYAANGVGTWGSSSGTITLGGIPTGATVEIAYIYWVCPSNYGLDTYLYLDGNGITGTQIGRDGVFYGYRAEITDLVTGNGDYEITDLTDAYGASIVVIYSDPSSNYVMVMVKDGMDTNYYETIPHWLTEITFSGFIATANPKAHLTYILGDGQTMYMGRYAYDKYSFNGIIIAENEADGSDGNPTTHGWDTDTYDVSTYVLEGDTEARANMYEESDELLWISCIFSVTVQPPYLPPVANAGMDQIINEGDLVQFDGSASYQPNGTIESYEWDFDADVDSDGDGNLTNDVDGTGPNPTYIYGDDGVYDVTLKVMAKVEDGGVEKVDQDVIFCVDTSGSMSPRSINLAKEGLIAYVDEMEIPDHGAVVVFDSSVELMNPLTDDYVQLKDDIAGIPRPGGATHMGEALQSAIDELLLNGNTDYTQVIILLTDGVWNGLMDPLDQADRAATNNITIYTIGLGYLVDEDFLREVSNRTGGAYYFTVNGSDLIPIYKEISEIVEGPSFEEQSDTDTMEVTVNNVAPTVTLFIPPSSDESSPLTFEAEANDPGSDDLTFKWEFEYGPTIENIYYNNGVSPEPIYDISTNEIKSSEGTFPFIASDTVTHTYGDDFNYSLVLTVADDDNGVSTYNTTIKIDNMAPSITHVMIPYPVYEGSPLTFGARAEDQGSDDLTFQWNFGDSTPINTMTYYNDGVGPDPYPSPEGTYPFNATDTLDHTYGDDYNYSLTLTVTDDDGLSTTFTTKIIVYNVAPTIDQFGPFIVDEGEPITITGTATDPGSDDLTFTWEFELGPTITNVYYNDGISPDPSPSPWGTYPYIVTDVVSHTYGDDGIFNVTLTVEDDDSDATTYTTNITVNNVAPTVTIESVIMNVEVGLRVAGRKYNDVGMTLYEDGNLIGNVSIERMPGSPNEQMAWIPVSINFSRSYTATVTYIPEDPPNIGGNPVWIYLKSQNGSIKKIHHTFNVQQSKKRDSDHWNHVEPWEVDLNNHFIGLPFEIISHIIDPGSDDETLTFTYGSQVIIITHLNNPPNLDPYPSPEVNPVDVMDTTTMIYEGPGTITLVVKDDDNIRLGVGQGSDSINIT